MTKEEHSGGRVDVFRRSLQTSIRFAIGFAAANVLLVLTSPIIDSKLVRQLGPRLQAAIALAMTLGLATAVFCGSRRWKWRNGLPYGAMTACAIFALMLVYQVVAGPILVSPPQGLPVTELDRRIAAESEQAVVNAFENVNAGRVIVKHSQFIPQHGRFIRLTGASTTRPSYTWQLADYLMLERNGDFEKGSVPVRIRVVGGEVLSVDSISTVPTGNHIDVLVRHPNFRPSGHR